ncbi:MAG: hypothetical protein VYE73_16565 [Acidobacteriota bacterium]|nr:hypothetical protein [Acidobacteriota bacterium]
MLPMLAALAASLVAAAQGVPSGNVRWLRVEGPNFTVISDAKEKAAREVLDSLEGLHQLLSTVTSEPTTMPVRTFVFAFRDQESLAAYSPWPKRLDVAGFFVPGAYRNYMGVDASTLASPAGVAYHEYLHFFAYANFPAVPLWFNEGLAEYYSTFRIEGRQAQVGRPRWEHLEWLKANRLIPLSELLAMDTRSPLYNESNRVGAFYVQAWAMVHYLFSDEDRAAGVARFLDLLARGQPVERSFGEAFGQTFDEFERGLRAYIGSRVFNFLRTPVERRTEVYSVEILDVPEALTILGDFLANLGPERAQQARRHFDEALRLDANWAAAQVGHGWLCHQIDDLRCAIERYRRAAVKTGSSEIGLFLLGEALVERLEAEIGTGPLSSEQLSSVSEARHSLTRALELNPSFAPTQVSLGWTYLHDGDPDAGFVALRRALEVAPADPRVLFGLAVLRARGGEFGRAWALTDELAAQEGAKPVSLARPELVVQLRAAVAREQANRATEAVNDGDGERAIEIILSLRPRLEAYRLSEELRQADEVTKHARHNIAVDAIRQARRLRNEGEIQQALELVDKAIPALIGRSAILQATDLKASLEEKLAD